MMEDFAKNTLTATTVILGLCTLLGLCGILFCTYKKFPFEVSGNWGGFGGGLGGWRLSGSIVILFITIFFGAAFALVSAYDLYFLSRIIEAQNSKDKKECCPALPTVFAQPISAIVMPPSQPCTPVPCPTCPPIKKVPPLVSQQQLQDSSAKNCK